MWTGSPPHRMSKKERSAKRSTSSSRSSPSALGQGSDPPRSKLHHMAEEKAAQSQSAERAIPSFSKVNVDSIKDDEDHVNSISGERQEIEGKLVKRVLEHLRGINPEEFPSPEELAETLQRQTGHNFCRHIDSITAVVLAEYWRLVPGDRPW
eukprot:6375616-Prorocentrum_lima.AAC.1